MSGEEKWHALLLHERKKLLKLAQEILPSITEDDLLQPFDYPELEENPDFRYQEGIVAGILIVKAALYDETLS